MSLKRPDRLQQKDDPAATQAKKVFEGISTPKQELDDTNKIRINFYVSPQDYKALRCVAQDMGLSAGATIRMAMREFLKKKGAI
jgi:hypothetical protein